MPLLQTAGVLSLDWLAGTFFSILLVMVGFFLVAFYKKVDQIANDVKHMQINGAARDQKIKSIEERLSHIEKKLGIN